MIELADNLAFRSSGSKKIFAEALQMKTPEDSVAYIARQIGYVYHHRPLMYGGTGAGVDLLLHAYHDIWSVIVERHQEFREVWWRVLEEENCGSANFSTRHSTDHPGASDLEIASYVVQQWQKVSERLDVPIPHRQIAQELERDFGPKERWQF